MSGGEPHPLAFRTIGVMVGLSHPAHWLARGAVCIASAGLCGCAGQAPSQDVKTAPIVTLQGVNRDRVLIAIVYGLGYSSAHDSLCEGATWTLALVLDDGVFVRRDAERFVTGRLASDNLATLCADLKNCDPGGNLADAPGGVIDGSHYHFLWHDHGALRVAMFWTGGYSGGRWDEPWSPERIPTPGPNAWQAQCLAAAVSPLEKAPARPLAPEEIVAACELGTEMMYELRDAIWEEIRRREGASQ